MTTIHLARDLGHVIDDLLERSTQTATAELATHNLTLCDLRVLRALDRRTGLVALTRRGHALANELERARRNELELFIDELPHAERLRLEAAVHLLAGDLGGRLAAA